MENECTSAGCEREPVVAGTLSFEKWTKKVQYCEEHRQTVEMTAARDGLTLTLEEL